MLKIFKGADGHARPLPQNLSVEIVRDLDRFYAIRKEWVALENRVQDPLTYFQSFDWCEKWCRIFAPDMIRRGGSIHIALIRKNGKLAAIAPMAIENRKGLALVLRFMGEPHIQYAKVLMDTALLGVNELRQCLDRITSRAKCDAVWLDHLVFGSPLHACLRPEECFESPDDYASAIDLTVYGSAEEYRQGLTRQSRKSRNRKRKKLRAMGNLGFQVVDGHDPRFRDLCEISLGQKRIWLAETGRPTSKIEDDRLLRMLGELGVDTGRHSGAIAFALTLDDHPIALEIGFWRHDHYYSYLGSFDWDMRLHSPGKLLLEDAICWSIENGMSTYDLLGNPSEYKNELASHRIALVAYAHGKTLAGNAYSRLWRPRVKPSIKQSISIMPVSLRQKLFGAAGRYLNK